MLTCILLLTFAIELCVSISISIAQGSYGKIILWMLMSQLCVCVLCVGNLHTWFAAAGDR